MIVVLLSAIIVFFGSALVSPQRAHRAEGALSTVSIQVLDGCAPGGAAEVLSKALLPGDGSLLYDIIETEDTQNYRIEKTTLIDRRGSEQKNGELSEKARRIAGRLGIDEKDVVLLRLEDNILNIDVTVIAGCDYDIYVKKLKKPKEASL